MNPPKPWRYKLRSTKLTFWQSVSVLLKTWEWKTIRQDFVVVNPDSPEYDEAPFEASVIYARVPDMEFPPAQAIYKR